MAVTAGSSQQNMTIRSKPWK